MTRICSLEGCNAALDTRNRSGICRKHFARDRMKALHADPEFAAANKARSRDRMKALHADPEFAAAHKERARERMKALNADPEFAAAHKERARSLNADPEFAAAHKERSRERMKALNADPEFNPLVLLSVEERADYDALKAVGYSRRAALAAIWRLDIEHEAKEG